MQGMVSAAGAYGKKANMLAARAVGQRGDSHPIFKAQVAARPWASLAASGRVRGFITDGGGKSVQPGSVAEGAGDEQH